MGLYDQAQQTNTPFMSNFVGAPVPEINQYSQLVQGRYNEAANSDDSLSEALGNLSHLGLDADTQYANELKSTYYNRLQDRADSGDFENMGRRTRQDAIRFSQAYQPLLQRQRDMSEVIKNIQSDDKVADPATKQGLIQKAMFMSTPQKDPTTGDYIRDANGRIQLGNIQNAVYAPDVDKDKLIADELEHKKAEIRQTGFTSDGQGNKVSSINEVLKPESMAALADKVQQTNPKIAAMINRDVDLQNYRLTPNQVTGTLESSNLNKSRYQQLKARGMNDQDIALLAGKDNNQTIDDYKQVPLQNLRQQYINRGFSPEAADRAILNDQTAKQMRTGSNDLAGDIFSVNNHKIEERADEPWLINFKHNLEQADKFNVATMSITEPGVTPVATDPHKLTTSYVDAQQAMDAKGTNLKKNIGFALDKLNLSTPKGDPNKSAKDIALIQQYANDPQKTAQLATILQKKDPDAADALISFQKNYMDLRDQASAAKANTEGLEKASGVDPAILYQQYLKDAKSNTSDSSMPAFLRGSVKDILPYNAFLNALRSTKDPKNNQSNFSSTGQPFNDAQKKYNIAIEKGMNTYNSGGKTYHALESLDNGDRFGQISQAVSTAAKTGALQIQEDGSNEATTLPKLLNLDPKDPKQREQLANTKVTINSDPSANGKLTASINDGVNKTRVVALNNLDPSMESEINTMLYKSAGNSASPEYAKTKFEDVQTAMGEKYANLMPASELENKPISTVHYPLNDHSTVQIKSGGELGKRYQLYVKDPTTGKETPGAIYNSTADMYKALGAVSHYLNNQPQRK